MRSKITSSGLPGPNKVLGVPQSSPPNLDSSAHPPSKDPARDPEADAPTVLTTSYTRRARDRRRMVLFPVLGLIIFGVCGLAVLGVMIGRVGTVAVLIGAVAALVPVALVISAFLWVDRWEPEPSGLLAAALLWGACVATIASLLVNNSAQALADLITGSDPDRIVAAVIAAPVIEEATKCAFVLGVFLLRDHEFDGVVDGIVYSGLVAAGFAFTENILYFGTAFVSPVETGAGGVNGLLAVVLLRGGLMPFAHPMFTVVFGIALGSVALSRSRRRRVLIATGGFLGAVAMHSLWNSSATFGADRFIDLYMLVMVPLFSAMVWLVLWQRRREQRVFTGQLPGLVAREWIAASELAPLSSLAGRRRWRAQARRLRGPDTARAVAAYQAAVTELAYFRHRLTRLGVDADQRHRHQELLARVQLTRAAATAAGRRTGGANTES